MNDYIIKSQIFKVLSDPVRLQILDVISCGELCACDILKNLSITQPTLSHHMKALIDSGMVNSRKCATWMYYSIDYEKIEQLHRTIDELTHPKEACCCKLTENDMSCSPNNQTDGPAI